MIISFTRLGKLTKMVPILPTYGARSSSNGGGSSVSIGINRGDCNKRGFTICLPSLALVILSFLSFLPKTFNLFSSYLFFLLDYSSVLLVLSRVRKGGEFTRERGRGWGRWRGKGRNISLSYVVLLCYFHLHRPSSRAQLLLSNKSNGRSCGYGSCVVALRRTFLLWWQYYFIIILPLKEGNTEPHYLLITLKLW